MDESKQPAEGGWPPESETTRSKTRKGPKVEDNTPKDTPPGAGDVEPSESLSQASETAAVPKTVKPAERMRFRRVR